ncbi:sulfatase [Lentisphaera marina]|uniref:sulfatase n=1 Tax=Lentisphaera marina TaxID=1111041 RepID=UPI0023666740|nr:sulfatase [Lentisphaera marina]MDD7986565.1 sulfatase [Lentisphaera marina]
MNIFSKLLFTNLLISSICLMAQEKPNFIFILVDDMPWFGTSVEQMEGESSSKMVYRRTPHIASIAENGMTFSNAYAAAGMCAPSRSSIQSGVSPAKTLFSGNGGFGEKSPKEVEYPITKKNEKCLLIEPTPLGNINTKYPTIGTYLKTQGYATAHIGKWHIYGGGPEKHGYDVSSGETSNDEGSPKNITDPNDPKRIFSITKDSIKFIEKQSKKEKPFFIQVSHYAEHSAQMSLPETLAIYEKDPAIKAIKDKKFKKEVITHGSAVTDMDTSIGMIIDKLTELNILENTYVIFTSDNGKGLLHDKRILRGSKWSLWEGGIRVPFMVMGPGIEAKSRCTENIIGYDMLPTLYELAGGSTEDMPNIDGESIAPLLTQAEDHSFPANRALYFHYPHYRNNTPQSMIIKGNFKLFRFYEIPGQPYLFNLKNDISEEVNLASQMPEKVQELQKNLDQYLESSKAYLPKPNTELAETVEPVNVDKLFPPLSAMGEFDQETAKKSKKAAEKNEKIKEDNKESAS